MEQNETMDKKENKLELFFNSVQIIRQFFANESKF